MIRRMRRSDAHSAYMVSRFGDKRGECGIALRVIPIGKVLPAKCLPRSLGMICNYPCFYF